MICKRCLHDLRARAYDLLEKHDLQHRVLHCGNNSIMTAKPSIHEAEGFNIREETCFEKTHQKSIPASRHRNALYGSACCL
jgi:hypothetical protein